MTTGEPITVPRRGDVVLVPFPYAELTATKARPALVMSGQRFFRAEKKILLAAITSNVTLHRGPVNFHLAQWKGAGLLKPSVVTSWLATLSPALILMRIGSLSPGDLQGAAAAVRSALEL